MGGAAGADASAARASAANTMTIPAASATRRRQSQNREERITAALYLAPAGLLVSFFVLFPIGLTLWMSLNDVDQFGRFGAFRGAGNYLRLLADPQFVAAAGRTVNWTVAIVGVTTILSLFLAVVLQQKFMGRALVRGLLLLPWATGLVIVSLLWRWMAHPDFGAIGHLVNSVGFPNLRVEWLGNPALSFPLMIWVGVWASIPFTTLVLAAGIQTINTDLYEAATLDGANRWHLFRYITLPQLRPVLAVSILLNVIFVFNSFPIIWVMTEGGPAGSTDTLITYLYRKGFRFYEMGVASAVSVVVFLILLAFAVIHTRIMWRNVLR
jgi:multiple sugar transport system permease protein